MTLGALTPLGRTGQELNDHATQEGRTGAFLAGVILGTGALCGLIVALVILLG